MDMYYKNILIKIKNYLEIIDRSLQNFDYTELTWTSVLYGLTQVIEHYGNVLHNIMLM